MITISNEAIYILCGTVLFIGLIILVLMENGYLGKRRDDFIDLSRYSNNDKIFTRINYRSRNRHNMYKISKKNEKVTILIPKGVMSITPRFFEDLFKETVIKIGKEEFKKKFKFITMEYAFEKNLNEAITRIERKRVYEFV
ncbi:MAG: hypothetical protein SLAVMIC_00012 [uncultured marine phage]|uniref:Uncharacterized protein n=1 Tax=uncultured marine phage TaxID=707152 RepID=A0A8D9CBI8_9VIRU|nr:MAG: hypothetical protein SLAVMIC_00012 [uncultured marine phage]